jgi:ParB family chromosome partitioning protein
MPTKSDFKAAQERIFARPRPESKSDIELLRKTEDDGVYPSPMNVRSIRLDRLVPDPDRPPHTYSEASLRDLGQSLLAHGQMSPILVEYQSEEDRFLIVDGERRWRAAQSVGLQSVQAIVLGRMTPAERCARRIALAVHQSAWDADERAQALAAYKVMQDLTTWAEVAEQIGVSDATMQTLLLGTSGAELGSEPDPVQHVVAAMRLLEHALERVSPEQSESAGIVQALADLSSCLSAHRARLHQAKAKTASEHKASSEGAAKPVRRMPTWGQR